MLANVDAFFLDQRKRPTGHSHPLVRTQKQWQIGHSPLVLAVFEQAAVQQQESCAWPGSGSTRPVVFPSMT